MDSFRLSSRLGFQRSFDSYGPLRVYSLQVLKHATQRVVNDHLCETLAPVHRHEQMVDPQAYGGPFNLKRDFPLRSWSFQDIDDSAADPGRKSADKSPHSQVRAVAEYSDFHGAHSTRQRQRRRQEAKKPEAIADPGSLFRFPISANIPRLCRPMCERHATK